MGGLPTAESLPAALVTREQWVAWRTQDRNGTETKVPVDPATGNFASATGPDSWTDFATARAYAADRDLGIGFVFTADDPLVGVDLDKCRDPDAGSRVDWATDIIDRLDSYTEVSPSGTGFHVLVNGDLPGDRNRSGDIECYDDARFFTVTGDHVAGTPTSIERRQDALRAIHAEYVAAEDPGGDGADDVGADERGETDAGGRSDAGGERRGDRAERPAASQQAAASESATAAGNDLTDEELIERARDAANGEKFDRLWRGNTGGYPSQSEADMALCSLLAFWTGGDADQIDRLFRDSGLMREKWDEPHFADGATYGERTIERAIAGSDEFYDPAGATGDADHSAASGEREATENGTNSDSSHANQPGDASSSAGSAGSAGSAESSGSAGTAASAGRAGSTGMSGSTGSAEPAPSAGTTTVMATDETAPAAGGEGETMVPKRVVDDLNETVQTLERETEQLRAELAAREARIADLEAELEAERESGWFDGLFGGLFGRSD